MQKSAKIALIAVIVVVLGGGGAFWFFVLRDTAPPKPTLNLTSSGNGSGSGGGNTTGSTAANADGSWTIKLGTEDFAGYRIQEVFGGDTIKKDAAGRTTKVTGSIDVKGTSVEKAEFTVDMTTIASDRPPRDGFMKTNGLETDTFKTATFKLTSPITLPESPVSGKQYDVTAKGELTLHGQTKPVDVAMKAGWTGTEIKAVGEAPVILADYGITKLQLGPATVDDHGTVEFSLTFVKA